MSEPLRVLAIAANAAWNIANFRAGLIQGLQRCGWEVVALAPLDEHADRLEAIGCRVIDTPMRASGTSPSEDLRLLKLYKRVLRDLSPTVYMGYTIKPNVYGSIAARALGIPVVNNITGLGSTFIGGNWLTWLVRRMYRHGLRGSSHVLFENEDDLELFVTSGLASRKQSMRIPSCGVNLRTFSPVPLPPRLTGEPLRFLMIGRMLRDKGVGELIEAIRLLRRRGVAIECSLLGFLDAANPTSITRAQVESWQAEGLVRYLGSTNDVRPFIANAHCIVLPSYREGVPRALLEAASMGRALIATDVVGCRDAVTDGVNGLLVAPRNARDLADKMQWLTEQPMRAIEAMGRAGEEMVRREFDEDAVIDRYAALLNDLARPPAPAQLGRSS